MRIRTTRGVLVTAALTTLLTARTGSAAEEDTSAGPRSGVDELTSAVATSAQVRGPASEAPSRLAPCHARIEA